MPRRVFLLIIMNIIALNFSGATVSGMAFNESNTVTDDTGDMVMKCLSGLYQYRNRIDSIEAETYMYGVIDIVKKNILISPLRRFIFVGNKPKDGFFETFGKIQYFFPGYYTFKPEAFNGNVNLYSTGVPKCVYNDLFSSDSSDGGHISPISPRAEKYYTYILEKHDDNGLVVISFKPKNSSSRLTWGSMIIDKKKNIVKKIIIYGTTSFASFRIEQIYRENRETNFLPTRIILDINHSLLGNNITQRIESYISYKKIIKRKVETVVNKNHITRYLTITPDSIKVITDSAYWNRIRSQNKYSYIIQDKDSVRSVGIAIIPEKIKEEFKKGYSVFHKTLGSPQKWNMGNTNFHYSGLIIPSLFSYSGTNGFVYTQRVNMSHIFRNRDVLYINPEIEYQSKHKHLLYKISCGYEYNPMRLGTFSVNLGKDNTCYSFSQAEETDTNWKFGLDYVELKNSIELFNGFLLKNMIMFQKWENGEHTAKDFIPGLTVYYTPEQYYWINGKQKEYLYSPFPTIGMMLSYSIPGKDELSSEYLQVETEVFQLIQTGISHQLSYYVSMGKRWNKGYYRPANFSAFSLRYPSSIWIERNGNLFYNLPYSFYDVPDSYVQSQVRIRGDLLLLSKIRNPFKRYIFSEQLLINHLVTEQLKSYTEIGYGVMNELLEFTFIAGFEKIKYKNFGVKVRVNFIH